MVTVDNLDMEKNISLIHAQPLSSHFNSVTQHMFYGHSSNNRVIKVITQATSLAVGLTTSCIAIAEAVASLAYATLATLIHLVTFCRSTSLQNHVIQSWAFCRHSFLMTLTPILLFSHSSEDSIYDVQFREHLYKINSAQAAQSIGTIFNFFACRKGKEGISRAKMASVEVAIEGLTKLIRKTKHRMQATYDHEGNRIFPNDLPKINQYQFVDFLKKFDNVKMSEDFNRYFSRLKLNDPNSKKFVERVVVAMAIHYRKMNPNFEKEIVDFKHGLQYDDKNPILEPYKHPGEPYKHPGMNPQKPVQAIVPNPEFQKLIEAQEKLEEEQLNNDAEFAERLQEQLRKEAEEEFQRKKAEEDLKLQKQLEQENEKIQQAAKLIQQENEKIKRIEVEKAERLQKQVEEHRLKKLVEGMQNPPPPKEPIDPYGVVDLLKKGFAEKQAKQPGANNPPAPPLLKDDPLKVRPEAPFFMPKAPVDIKKEDLVKYDSDSSDDEDEVIQKNPIHYQPPMQPKKEIPAQPIVIPQPIINNPIHQIPGKSLEDTEKSQLKDKLRKHNVLPQDPDNWSLGDLKKRATIVENYFTFINRRIEFAVDEILSNSSLFKIIGKDLDTVKDGIADSEIIYPILFATQLNEILYTAENGNMCPEFFKLKFLNEAGIEEEVTRQNLITKARGLYMNLSNDHKKVLITELLKYNIELGQNIYDYLDLKFDYAEPKEIRPLLHLIGTLALPLQNEKFVQQAISNCAENFGNDDELYA